MIIDNFLGQEVRYPDTAIFMIQSAKLTRRSYKVNFLIGGSLRKALEKFEEFKVPYGYVKRLVCTDFHKNNVLLKFVNN